MSGYNWVSPFFQIQIEYCYIIDEVVVAVREHEAEGHLVLLGERDDRYMRYVHDPAAIEDDEDEAEETAAS